MFLSFGCLLLKWGLRSVQQVGQKLAGGQGIHSTFLSVSFVLFFADPPDFRVARLRMCEYESADGCIGNHGIAVS